MDYQKGIHKGFAFVEYEDPEVRSKHVANRKVCACVLFVFVDCHHFHVPKYVGCGRSHFQHGRRRTHGKNLKSQSGTAQSIVVE